MNISEIKNITPNTLFHLDLTCKHPTINKPYTSAPKMANSIDYNDLIEIPLSTSSLEAKVNELNLNSFSLNTETIASTICDLNISPSDHFSGSILAVDELLKCSTKVDDSKLTMPYVEDGLSSESEINSPKLSPINSYIDNTRSNKSFLNSNLMKDIDDLRKTINGNIENHNNTNKTTFLQEGEVNCKLKQLNLKSNTHTNISSDNKTMYTDSKELSSDLDAHKEIKSDCNKYNKANTFSISRKGCETNFPFPASSNKSSELQIHDQSWKKFDKSICNRNGTSYESLEAQHWTFPMASHTVYSSSSSDEHDTDCEVKHKIEPHINDKLMKCAVEKPKILKTSAFQASDSVHQVENIKIKSHGEYESDEDTDKLLLKQYEHNGKIDIPELKEKNDLECERKRKGKEVTVRHPDYPAVLIEGLLFRANYLGSTQLHSEIKPSRDTRMIQAQEAVGRVKAPDSESQPSVAVDLFVSAEKILVLNTNLSEIMMDHNLKTISYIADIGDILVLMARRMSPSHQVISETSQFQNKILCHVFESDEAQLIAQSIGNAFQIAYIEYLKANGIDDPKIFKEVDYQDVLNDQEILTDELKMFSNKEQHKKVIIPKQRGEYLGVVIVESGWGSILPTVVLANMNPNGPAARCGLLNIGNQIISVNDNSLVGLPLSTCQQIIKKCKTQTAVKLTVVNCPPVVEVHIRRPDSKYQLGFSVQNGVICSLLRGGIAERGGVRVGHHIIEINGISVVAMSHEKIVNLLATAVGEIHLRTMPTSIFRLLTGQDTPHYI